MKKNLNISQEELLKLDYKHTYILKNLLMRMENYSQRVTNMSRSSYKITKLSAADFVLSI